MPSTPEKCSFLRYKITSTLYNNRVDASDCHCPYQAIISRFADLCKTACKTAFHFALTGKITHVAFSEIAREE